MKLHHRLLARLPAPWRARLRRLAHDWLPPVLWRRLGAAAPESAPAPASPLPGPASVPAAPPARPPAPVRSVAEMLRVIEVDDAEALVGALFRRRFGIDSFPAEPRHFVGFYKASDGALLPLGYVHHQIWENNSLCGGLVIDERLYRRLPAADRAQIHAAGGIAEAMLRGSFALLDEGLVAIWAHVGNPQSEKVCLRVGYRRTATDYVMVIWRQPELSAEEKAAWIKRVEAYGPF